MTFLTAGRNDAYEVPVTIEVCNTNYTLGLTDTIGEVSQGGGKYHVSQGGKQHGLSRQFVLVCKRKWVVSRWASVLKIVITPDKSLTLQVNVKCIYSCVYGWLLYVNGWLTQVTAKYDDNYLVNEWNLWNQVNKFVVVRSGLTKVRTAYDRVCDYVNLLWKILVFPNHNLNYRINSCRFFYRDLKLWYSCLFLIKSWNHFSPYAHSKKS